MLKSYPALFHQEADCSYWVEFPDFAGGTQGDDLEDAMKNAREMLESLLAAYIDEEIPLPVASDVATLSVDGGFVTLIQVDPTPFIRNNRAIRKNVTVPEWLIKLADREQLNYSEVLTSALKTRLHV